MGYVGSIPVEDASGAQFTVHEFEERRFFRKVKRHELCSGERMISDGETFVVVRTGERFTRVE